MPPTQLIISGKIRSATKPNLVQKWGFARSKSRGVCLKEHLTRFRYQNRQFWPLGWPGPEIVQTVTKRSILPLGLPGQEIFQTVTQTAHFGNFGGLEYFFPIINPEITQNGFPIIQFDSLGRPGSETTKAGTQIIHYDSLGGLATIQVARVGTTHS